MSREEEEEEEGMRVWELEEEEAAEEEERTRVWELDCKDKSSFFSPCLPCRHGNRLFVCEASSTPTPLPPFSLGLLLVSAPLSSLPPSILNIGGWNGRRRRHSERERERESRSEEERSRDGLQSPSPEMDVCREAQKTHEEGKAVGVVFFFCCCR